MTRLLTILALTLGLALPAAADVWKWVDATGKTHFVDTMKPIFTWGDEFGKRALARRHGDDLPFRAQILAAGPAGRTGAAGDQRIDRHAHTLLRSFNHGARGLMAKDERRRAVIVVAQKGMHV